MLKYYKNLAQNFSTLIPYVLEYNALNAFSTLKGHPLRDAHKHRKLKPQMIKYIEQGLKEDARLCSDLDLKREVLTPKLVIDHIRSLFNVYKDYANILQRRQNRDHGAHSDRDYPAYYNRSYHFQTDGYLSEYSASLYDHQVDILFAGMAAPMRRTLLEYFRDFNGKKVLELGCGTGSASEILGRAKPDLEITATDLSHDYISYAQKNRWLENIRYIPQNALEIEGEWEAIFHVFLLHELPSKERKKLLEKQLECLAPGGMGIVLESLQIGDIKFLDEVLYDFPKYYHEPFYKHYIEHSVEEQLTELGAINIQVTKRLFSKAISFQKA